MSVLYDPSTPENLPFENRVRIKVLCAEDRGTKIEAVVGAERVNTLIVGEDTLTIEMEGVSRIEYEVIEGLVLASTDEAETPGPANKTKLANDVRIFSKEK